MRFRALRSTPGGVWKRFSWPWEIEIFRIFTFWPGQGPAGPGPDRTEPGDAFESSVSDFEIRPMDKMLRAAGLKISFRRAKRASSVVKMRFRALRSTPRGGLENIFPGPGKVKISEFPHFGRARPGPGPARAPAGRGPARALARPRPGRPRPGLGPGPVRRRGGTPLFYNYFPKRAASDHFATFHHSGAETDAPQLVEEAIDAPAAA